MTHKGCGKAIHVVGTNGGMMPCGAMLTQLDGTKAPYYCDECNRGIGRYVPSTIDLNANTPESIGAFFGQDAQRYAYKPELRAFIDSLVESARRSTNRHFVIEGTTVRAAQSTRTGAINYMGPGKVLVSIEV
jgi:hypothetical protein